MSCPTKNCLNPAWPQFQQEILGHYLQAKANKFPLAKRLKTTYGLLISGKSQGCGCLKRAIFSVAIIAMLAASAYAASPVAAPQVSSPTHPDGSWSANNKPKFTWTGIVGADYYNYSIDASPETMPSGNKTDRNYVVLPTVPDGQKYFHIAACNPDGCSPAGHYLVRIDTSPPKPVDGLAGEYQIDGTVTLTWNDQNDTSGIKEYQIFRSTVQRTTNNRDFLPTDPGVRKYTSTGTTLSDTDKLREGAAFYYRALAVDNAGNTGAPSGVRTVRTFPPTGQESAKPGPVADKNNGETVVDVNQDNKVISDGNLPTAGQQGQSDTVITEKPGPKPQTNLEYAPAANVGPQAGAGRQSPEANGNIDKPVSIAGIILILIIAGGAAIVFFGLKPKVPKSPGHHATGAPNHGGAKWAATEKKAK